MLQLVATLHLGTLLPNMPPDALSNMGITSGISALAALIIGALALCLSFPSLTILLSALFLDEICAAIKTRHYAILPPARPVGFRESLRASARLMLRSGILNLSMPLYLASLLIILFVSEYYLLVAMLLLTPDSMETLFRKNFGRFFVVCAFTAFLMNLPILNLLAPMLAAGLMVHVFMATP